MKIVKKTLYSSDEDFINGIKEGNDKVLAVLYKLHFPMVLNFIVKNNGSDQEAKDIYQEGMINLYYNIKNETFKQESSIKTYLYSICRRLWLNELKRKNKFSDAVYDENDFILFDQEIEENVTDHSSKYKMMDNSLHKLGEPCQTILKDFYINKLSMLEIAQKMNYTNTENAKNQKYKCLQRLKKIYFSSNTSNNLDYEF